MVHRAGEGGMKLDYRKTFSVGVAFFLISVFWQAYDTVIPKILIDKFGLNQAWSGAVMAIDNVLALFLLPLFGGLSDRTASRHGRRTPYIVVGTVLAAFAFMALSFVDSYQTARIAQESKLIEEYGDVLAEKEVMLGSILSHGVSKQAQALAEGAITAPELASWQGEFAASIERWRAASADLLRRKQEALESGALSQRRYDRWYAAAHAETERIVAGAVAKGGLTQAEYSTWADEIYDGVLDANLAAEAWSATAGSPTTFVLFMAMLLAALVAMATFRSPAVALMPDVTIKPLRSKANAIINLMGAFGGIASIIILTVFALDKRSYVGYAPAFVTVGLLMLLLLGVFLWRVREPRLVKEKLAEEERYGLTEDPGAGSTGVATQGLSREKMTSLALILASVFLWFVGYNAVTTKFSDYAPKVLGIGYSIPLLIAQGAALLAFVPIGIVATRIGRRKTILIGIVILSLCFGSVILISESTSFVMYGIFALTGIGWATINVNSYPMVVELSKGSNVGAYTGYYYTFSMAAQVLTPILSGMLMDVWGRRILFPYATLFVALAFVTMSLVRHGDAVVIAKESKLEHLEVDMD
jgi:maltose/moltooligosaccharide transporter